MRNKIRQILKIGLICFFTQSNFTLANAETLPQQKVNIGVLAFNGNAQALTRWQTTAEYLSQHIPSHRFLIKPLTHDEYNHAINHFASNAGRKKTIISGRSILRVQFWCRRKSSFCLNLPLPTQPKMHKKILQSHRLS